MYACTGHSLLLGSRVVSHWRRVVVEEGQISSTELETNVIISHISASLVSTIIPIHYIIGSTQLPTTLNEPGGLSHLGSYITGLSSNQTSTKEPIATRISRFIELDKIGTLYFADPRANYGIRKDTAYLFRCERMLGTEWSTVNPIKFRKWEYTTFVWNDDPRTS